MTDEPRPPGGKGPEAQHRGDTIYNTFNHYHGPVNNIETASNANFGANYGQIYQAGPRINNPKGVFGPAMDLSPILDASHTRNRRRAPPDSNCLAGTRRLAIKNILGWAQDTPLTEKTHILWLCGPVGCGKSAVCQALAEDFDRRGRLVGSFFFFRGSGDRSKLDKLAITLAHQMRSAIPATRAAIDNALESLHVLRGASSIHQFQRLVFQPLQAATLEQAKPEKGLVMSLRRSLSKQTTKANPPVYHIVIDGLDECDDREDVALLIEDLLEYFKQNPDIPLRFLIASRIEEHIRARVERAEVRVENLHNYHPDQDMAEVARYMFKEAAEHNLVIRSYGEQWPAEEDLHKLLRHAHGSFVFITTLLKYILDLEASDGLTPMERFQLALNMDPGLDSLYSSTLKRAQHIPHFEDVVFTLALLREPLPIAGLAFVLDIPSPKVVNALIPLQSIIHVPGDDRTGVHLFHTSLRDFLLNEKRSDIALSISLFDRRDHLASRCLKLRLLELRVDDYPNPTEHYILYNWRWHWLDFQGSVRAQSRLNSLMDLARGVTPFRSFPADFASSFFSAAWYALKHVDEAMPRTYSYYTVETLQPSAEVVGSLFQAFCLLGTRAQWLPVAKPEAAIHQCMVMHSMGFIMSGDYIPPKPEHMHLNGRQSYTLENWACHLALAFVEGEPKEVMWDFLHAQYLPAMDQHGKVEGRVNAAAFQRSLRQAVKAVNKEFPDLVPTNAPEVEDLELPHRYDLPLYYYIYKEDGLTILDMLQIFCKLLLPMYPSYGMPGKSVQVHAHDGMVMEFNSRRSGSDQYLDISRYSLYHVDVTTKQ